MLEHPSKILTGDNSIKYFQFEKDKFYLFVEKYLDTNIAFIVGISYLNN